LEPALTAFVSGTTSSAAPMSNPPDDGPTEQASRSYDQHGDDGAPARSAEFQLIADAGNIRPGEVLEDADQEASDDGTGRTAQAAKDGGGKSIKQHAAIMFGSRNTTGAISMPPMATIAAAMPQPSATIQPVLIPTNRADSGNDAAARIASPVRVNRKNAYSRTNSSTVTPIMPALVGADELTAENGADPNGVGYCLMVKSQISPATLLRMANKAMNPATWVKAGALANGLNSSRSMTMPPANDSARVSRKAPPIGHAPLHQLPGNERREHRHFALREVEKFNGLEDHDDGERHAGHRSRRWRCRPRFDW